MLLWAPHFITKLTLTLSFEKSQQTSAKYNIQAVILHLTTQNKVNMIVYNN